MATVIKCTLMQYNGPMKEEESMNEQTKTPEQLRAEMIRQLQQSGGEHLTEVAIPGVVQPIDSDKC